jgi:hypothetical protein
MGNQISTIYQFDKKLQECDISASIEQNAGLEVLAGIPVAMT